MDTTSLPSLPVLPSPASPPTTAPGTPDGVRTLVDEFLAEQGRMSAVERFASADDERDPAATSVPARWYRDLLPASSPGPGQQYAFAVDLDACSGCKACVTACHSLNGLDDGEAWRDVGLLVGTGDRALVQPVTTGCHHCVEPGCLDGCPVDAYVKDDDGIVHHLDDQCIGCSYCTLTCPYEVPQYDRSRGIVRKCDLCHDRLAVGEAPPCVQACPTEAIRITVVDVEEAGREGWGFTAPDPSTTRPATVFTTSRDLSTDVAPADQHTLRPRDAHLPLVVMLVLTQLAIGAFGLLELLRLTSVIGADHAAGGAAAALGVTGLALVASLAHLGRPQYAWRAVLGLRHSWLSREIVTFAAFAPLGALHATAVGDWLPVVGNLPTGLTGAVAVATGIAAVGTSVMVYVATGRAGWHPAPVATRFGLTTGSLGVLAVATIATVTEATTPRAAGLLTAVAVGLSLVALGVDLLPLRRADDDPAAPATRTARLLGGPLRDQVRTRVALGLLVAALGSVAALVLTGDDRGPAVVALLGALAAAIAAELLARAWFFAAEGSPRMPGTPA